MEDRKPRGPQPLTIEVTARQQEELARLTRSTSLPYAHVLRAQIILQASEGQRNAQITQTLGCHVNTVRTWRARWAEQQSDLAAREATTEPPEYQLLVQEVLADQPRSGSPGKFTPEQLCQIIAVACQPPADLGVPVSHWTPRALAHEVVQQAIVDSVSPRQVGRF